MDQFIKVTSITLLFVLFSLIFSSRVFAVSVTIDNVPSMISSDPFEVGVSVSGASNGTNYLRVDLYKDGTISYFGETYNGSSWYGGSDGTQYFPVQIQNASASATIQGRLGSPSNTEYSGPGAYKLKIRRYTSGSYYTFSDAYDVQITYATPSPSPAPTSSPTQTPAAASPTQSPSPTPMASPTKSPSPSPKLGTRVDNLPSEPPQNVVKGEILGLRESLKPESEASSGPAPKYNKKFPILATLLIFCGVGLLGVAIYSFFKKKSDETLYNGSNENGKTY